MGRIHACNRDVGDNVPVTVEVQVKNKKGQPIVKDGNRLTVKQNNG